MILATTFLAGKKSRTGILRTNVFLAQEGFSVAYLKKLKRAPSAIIYIKHGKIYVEGLEGDLRHPLVILWADYLYWLLQEVFLVFDRK